MMDHTDRPLIIGFVQNLMFTSKIESAVEALDYDIRWIGSVDVLGPMEIEPDSPKHQLAEPTQGRGSILLELITQLHPALIIFDLGNPDIPWEMWVAMIKSVPATRRLPVVCFGPHVDQAAFDSARARGADEVFARSNFLNNTGKIIQQFARFPDFEEIVQACRQPLSILAIKGLELFNHGKYFAAHEELEFAWNEDITVGRELYRGILQIAVAYLQIERQNYRGANKLFLRARQWLDPLPEICRGVNVGKLRRDAQAARQLLLELGPEGIDRFDRRLFKPVDYQT
jgi:hypothetical protein